MASTRRKPKPVAVQAAEMAFAVPQVVAHRLARMAIAGANPSARDRKEFSGMVAEKQLAFTQSWQAMAAAGACWAPWLTVLAHGMAPVHGKAVANAKRLARTRLR